VRSGSVLRVVELATHVAEVTTAGDDDRVVDSQLSVLAIVVGSSVGEVLVTVTRSSSSVVGAGCAVDVGCEVFDVGCEVFDVGCEVIVVVCCGTVVVCCGAVVVVVLQTPSGSAPSPSKAS
jgi:hypothetical protein